MTRKDKLMTWIPLGLLGALIAVWVVTGIMASQGWQTDDSMLPDRSFKVAQLVGDSKGSIWAVIQLDRYSPTESSLSRFDGRNWTSFTSTNSGLLSDTVSAIAVDEDDRLWVGFTESHAIQSFDDQGGWQTYRFADSLGPAWFTVSCVAISPGGAIWLGTFSRGVVVFDEGIWTHLRFDYPSRSARHISAIAFDRQSRPWIGSNTWSGMTGRWSGLSVIEEMKWIDYAGRGIGSVDAITFDATGEGWVGTMGRVVRLHEDMSGAQQIDLFQNPFSHVNSLDFDGHGQLWVSNGGNLVRYETQTGALVTFSEENSGLQGEELARGLVIDSQDRVWIGHENGVSVMNVAALPSRVSRNDGVGFLTLALMGVPVLEGWYWSGRTGKRTRRLGRSAILMFVLLPLPVSSPDGLMVPLPGGVLVYQWLWGLLQGETGITSYFVLLIIPLICWLIYAAIYLLHQRRAS